MSDDKSAPVLVDVTLRPAIEGVHETYIGDGCYASFDGYQIKLRVPCDHDDQEVCLERRTFEGLLQFARSYWRF